MRRPPNSNLPPERDEIDTKSLLVSVLLGFFFAVTLLKFGNPVILEGKMAPPRSGWEFLFQPWPVQWGYFLLVPVVLLAFLTANWQRRIPRFVLLLPLIWLGWQFIAATQTVDSELTSATLKHFSACVALFYVGCFAPGRGKNAWPIWAGITIAFLLILRVGLDQHFGGLEETRRFFYQQPNWQMYPADFIKKIGSNRIYSTLFYPNTLAGAILLLLPLSIVFSWQATHKLPPLARWIIVLALAFGGLACLYWSGSKAGWLLTLAVGLIALLHAPIGRKWKISLIALVLIAGLAGFALKYAGFFQKGSTSVVARFDYWKAAVAITGQHPIFGTGPGTFMRPYQKIKDPKAEMTRLTHNDYLQQASDSGIIGLLSYSGMVLVFIWKLYRYRPIGFGLSSAILLGLIGVSMHSFVEFHLYIPALAWLVFFFFGYLWGLEPAKLSE